MITFSLLIKLLFLFARNGEGSRHSSLSSKGGGENVIVSMKSSTISIINSDKTDMARDELATILTYKLKVFSKKEQSPVISVLDRFGADFQSFWITNQIFIKDASPSLIESLEDLKEVKSVEKEKLFKINLLSNLKLGKQPNGVEWHLSKMGVDKVWKKTKGEGIIVAAIDTGVRGSHEALINNFIGKDKFGWHDPILFSTEPEDISGHGTHVMGIIAGAGGIGAAPNSRWMACRGGLDLVLFEHAIIACAQFVLCPSDPKGEGNCRGVPDLVSNSWGGGGGGGDRGGEQDQLTQVIMAWMKVGIKPFFAAGNEGPDCKSVGSPADFDDVIAVGSTDIDDRLDESSSRGPPQKYNETGNEQSIGKNGLIEAILVRNSPSPTNKIKPDIVAPGVEINSAYFMTDKSYKKMTGTSMATPAAAGVAALLLSIKPTMTLKELKRLLYSTTDKHSLSKKDDKNLFSSNSEQCGSIPDDKFPNNFYGHGRINAYKALKKLQKQMKSEKVKNKQVSKS